MAMAAAVNSVNRASDKFIGCEGHQDFVRYPAMLSLGLIVCIRGWLNQNLYSINKGSFCGFAFFPFH